METPAVNKNYDIVIVGGGVIGGACAYYLSKRKNLSIAVVDATRRGCASRASAGGLWAIGESVGLGCGVIFFRAMSKQTAEVAAAPAHPHVLPSSFLDFAMASNALYPALHAELEQVHGVDFKFERTGLKFVMYDETDRRYAELIAESVPHLRQHLRWLDAGELRECEPYVTLDSIGALEFTCDHQVNPYRLMDSYLEAARQNGVTLIQNTNVTGIKKFGSRVTGVVTTEHGVLHCGMVINAAGSWAADVSEWASGFRLPVHPVKGQIVLSERLPKLLRGCISTADCYFMQKDNGEILIGSTTEEVGYDTNTNIEALRGLARGVTRCVPELQRVQIKRCWAGLRPGTPDELPILGPMPGIEGYLNACGHFRTGILTSAITGVVIDRMVHRESMPIDITAFSADRFRKHVPQGDQREPQLIAVY